MKLTVKTLKGGKFDVQVEDTHTVAQVKGAIVRFYLIAAAEKAAAPADGA